MQKRILHCRRYFRGVELVITPLSRNFLTTDVMASANNRWCHDVLMPLSGDVTRRHVNECKTKSVYSASELKVDYCHYVRCTLTGTKFLSVQVTVPRKTWRDREEEHKIGPLVLIYRWKIQCFLLHFFCVKFTFWGSQHVQKRVLHCRRYFRGVELHLSAVTVCRRQT